MEIFYVANNVQDLENMQKFKILRGQALQKTQSDRKTSVKEVNE